MDHGSIDETAVIVERSGRAVTCIRQENRGVAAARNWGARESGTEWAAFLDADNICVGTTLVRQWNLRRDGDAGAVFTAVGVVGEDLGAIPNRRASGVRDDLKALLLHDEMIPQGTASTLLVRYSTFAAIGGWDETLSTMADWDLLIRLRMRTPFAHVAEPLVLYRRGSMSRKVELLEHDSARILQKAFSSSDMPLTVRRLGRRCLAWNDLVLSGSYLQTGSYVRAVRLAVRSVLREPSLAARVVGFPYRYLTRWVNGRWVS